MFHPLFRRYHPFFALCFRALVRVFAPRYRVSGRSHLPLRGPLILASNHISDSDPPVLGAAVRFPIAWMAKRELWQMRALAPVLEFVGSFPVDPATPDRAALKLAAQVLQNGDALVVFPEGHISPDGELGVIMPGAMLLALKSGATVVPVGMWGAQNIVPHGSLVPRPTLAPVRVHFGAPLRFDDLKDLPPREARVQATRRLENALREARSVAQGRR